MKSSNSPSGRGSPFVKNLKSTLLLALALIAFTASLRAEFLYVSSYDNGLLSFSINPNTGALIKLPGSPLVKPANISEITLDRTGKLLYATTNSAIYGYRIAGNGQLIPLPGSPYKVTGGGLAVDPYNRFLYATANDSVCVYRIEPNGSLRAVAGSPFSSPGARSLAVDPFGRFIYVRGTLISFADGYYSAKGVVSVFNVVGANGTLRPVAGSPFATGHEYTVQVTAEKTGRFIYVACDLEASILTYRVSPNGGLTQVLPTVFSGGPWCENLAYNPVNNHLYITNDRLAEFSLNPVTGIPENPTPPPFRPGLYNMENTAVGVCVSPNGQFVYIGNSNQEVDPTSMSLRGWKVGPTGRLLTEVPGSPYYPLGFTLDEALVGPSLGWPSTMVVAP